VANFGTFARRRYWHPPITITSNGETSNGFHFGACVMSFRTLIHPSNLATLRLTLKPRGLQLLQPFPFLLLTFMLAPKLLLFSTRVALQSCLITATSVAVLVRASTNSATHCACELRLERNCSQPQRYCNYAFCSRDKGMKVRTNKPNRKPQKAESTPILEALAHL
jgi:hypothetical protein